uniref:Uncharacterized protein n=1 Tax=Cyprinodon variegatus TaxID=28743 RepID=A0A3Q2GH53_CYPVA
EKDPTTVLGVVVLFIVIYLVSVGSTFRGIGIKPPGLKPLPLLVYFGPKKVVVLAGHKMVKEALVNYADEFGDREITPIFDDRTKGHGILFSNGETWKEMRQFALITLREFGMGKRVAEEKILEECGHLIQMFENYKGKPLNTSRPINYARSNISSSIVYGSRFEYDDPSIKRAG